MVIQHETDGAFNRLAACRHRCLAVRSDLPVELLEIFNEGCLSIPDVREDVLRNESIRIQYWDENFQEHTRSFNGLIARVIQHEYDHIEGILFTDKLSPLKKRLIKRKLTAISQGKINPEYPMRFPQMKRKR